MSDTRSTILRALACRIARQDDLSPIDLRDHSQLLFGDPTFVSGLALEYEECTDGDETLRPAAQILFMDCQIQGLAHYVATCPAQMSVGTVIRTHMPAQRLVLITATRDGIQTNARGITAQELRSRQLNAQLQDLHDYRVWSTFYTLLWRRIQRLNNPGLQRELQGYLVRHQNELNAERIGHVYAALGCTDEELTYDKSQMHFR